ncbi:MAG TPA: hypothetical protein VLA20_12590, partial [Vicinamibacterales bacterium]|nr:hypothetical protein [Vicinamibacterales bacterium]
MTARRLAMTVIAAGGLAAVLVVASRAWPTPAGAEAEIGLVVPTAVATRGTLDRIVHLRGELRATRHATLAAPSVGGMLRILDMLETGAVVRAGDMVVEFDPAEQLYALEQARSKCSRPSRRSSSVR